jgi:Ca2+-binding EF-hand superfamily protein
MSEINFHPDDKIMTLSDLIKKVGNIIFVLSIFIFFSYLYYIEDDTIIPLIVCGLPLTLMVIIILIQSMMHVSGFGKMVMNNNEMVLRTSRSGLKKNSRLSSLNKIITYPMAKMMMKEADKDGDGRISFDELTKMSFEDLSINQRPWDWDFKMAYDKISKKFDLPSDNPSISFNDFSVYTDSEDRTNFDEIDVDNDGFITKEQFVDYFWELGKSELIELRIEFDKCDGDGDGYLSLEELSAFMGSNQDDWAEEKANNWWSK